MNIYEKAVFESDELNFANVPLTLYVVKHTASSMYFVGVHADGIPMPPGFIMSPNPFNAWYFPEQAEAVHVQEMLGDGWNISQTSQLVMSEGMREIIKGSFGRPFKKQTRSERRSKRGSRP